MPFLHDLAAFAKTPAGLARRYGRPISVGFCRRSGPGFRFVLTLYPKIRPDLNLSAREDIARMTRTWVGYLESFVREHPDQYLWMHRQWRTPVVGDELVDREGQYIRRASFDAEQLQALAEPQPVTAGIAGDGQGQA